MRALGLIAGAIWSGMVASEVVLSCGAGPDSLGVVFLGSFLFASSLWRRFRVVRRRPLFSTITLL